MGPCGRCLASPSICSATAAPPRSALYPASSCRPDRRLRASSLTRLPSRSTTCSVLYAKCVRQYFISAIRASSSDGLSTPGSTCAACGSCSVALTAPAAALPWLRLLPFVAKTPRSSRPFPLHYRTHRRIGLQRRRIIANPPPRQQPTISQHLQQQAKASWFVSTSIPPCPRYRRVVRCVFPSTQSLQSAAVPTSPLNAMQPHARCRSRRNSR